MLSHAFACVNNFLNMFKERLKKLRQSANLSQKQLGELSSTSERTIQDYESGRRKPGLDALIALSNVLNTSIDYLVGLSDDPTRH